MKNDIKLKEKGTQLKRKDTKLTTLQAQGGSCPPLSPPVTAPDFHMYFRMKIDMKKNI